MPSSLPVPSKAALTALRGLVLGTSCTLALIAEDRRRKINNALRVIENGEKIKSARGYRPGGSAFALALEEEALLDAGLLPVPPGGLELHQHNAIPGSGLVSKTNKKGGESIGHDGVGGRTGEIKQELKTTEEVSDGNNAAVHQANTPARPAQPAKTTKRSSAQIPATPSITPQFAAPAWLSTPTELLESVMFPSSDEIMAKIHQACDIKDQRQMRNALQYVIEAMDKNLAPSNQDQAWIQATALLCRTCQEVEQIDDALKLLMRVIAWGPLNESDYMDHEPLRLIESLLERAVTTELVEESQEATKSNDVVEMEATKSKEATESDETFKPSSVVDIKSIEGIKSTEPQEAAGGQESRECISMVEIESTEPVKPAEFKESTVSDETIESSPVVDVESTEDIKSTVSEEATEFIESTHPVESAEPEESSNLNESIELDHVAEIETLEAIESAEFQASVEAKESTNLNESIESSCALDIEPAESKPLTESKDSTARCGSTRLHDMVEIKATHSKEADPFACIVDIDGTVDTQSTKANKAAKSRKAIKPKKVTEVRRVVDVNMLDAAINLFLPKFATEPADPVPGVYNVGRKLVEAAFLGDRMKRIMGLYRRCNMHAGENSADLASWFMTSMHETHDYKNVVKVFLSTYAKSSPNEASIQAVGDIVIDSVENAVNYRPADVLRALRAICSSGNTKLSPKWVMKLLVSHWNAHRKLDEIEALFAELQIPSLREMVFRSDIVYRIMVELSLEADDEEKAEFYFKAAVAACPDLASDVRMLGIFARFHAKEGNWDAVRTAFKAMQWRKRSNEKAYGQVFVPVLKAYAEGHGIRETEEFLKFYIDEMKVPLSSYMVTLMAKHYAAVRDLDSLVEWLDYCTKAGFPVDAAFTNAILVRCRKDFNFRFRDLRRVFRKLRFINPDYIDKYSERVMMDSALVDSKYGGKFARGRVLSLLIERRNPKYPQAEDVALSIKEELVCGRPGRALWTYKRALHRGVPYSHHALRLAVQAQLMLNPTDYEAAYSLIQEPQQRGEDVNRVINYLLGKRLGNMITSQEAPDEMAAAVEETLASFDSAGVKLNEFSLHYAAQTCLHAGLFQAAVTYALRAAQARTPPAKPCFNLQNFRILLNAYTELVDVTGLRDTVSRALAPASSYRERADVRRLLKNARGKVMNGTGRAVSMEQMLAARRVLEDGLRERRRMTARLWEQKRRFEQEAVRIMKAAAVDAGREVGDLEKVPWLHPRGSQVWEERNGLREKKEEVVVERVGEVAGEEDYGFATVEMDMEQRVVGGPYGLGTERMDGNGRDGGRDLEWNPEEDTLVGEDDPFMALQRELDQQAVHDAYGLGAGHAGKKKKKKKSKAKDVVEDKPLADDDPFAAMQRELQQRAAVDPYGLKAEQQKGGAWNGAVGDNDPFAPTEGDLKQKAGAAASW